MYSIQLYDDTAQEYGAKISQGLQSPVSVTERLDGGIDTARFTMHTKLTSPPKQWQKVRLWTQDEPAPPAIEWAASAMPASTTWKSAVYGGGKWLAFGDHGTGEYYAYLSYDNMQSWESIPGDALFGVKVVGAAYGDKFVVAWDYTSAPGYSSDGINWTFQSGAVTIDQKCIAYGGGRYVVAGEDTHCIYSIDGINWVRVPIDAAAYAWSAIAYGSGKFVILAKGSDKCAYSSGGASWTLGSMPSSGAWASIAYGDKFVAIKDFDSGETNKCAVSADGANWQEKTLPVSARWSKIVYGNGKYVLMSTSGITLISDDAETWEQMQLPASSFWRVLAFGSNVCLAIDGDGATDVCATMKVPDVFPEAYADYFVNNCRSDLITRLPGLKVYRWDVELVGLIKVTQKLPMGNLCFSNDVAEDGTVTQKTYAQVLDRLNNQIFTVLEEDRENVPFRLRINPAYIPFLSEYAPELFFTGNTLFECLERIGQTQDSFPELYFYTPGVYTLSFRKYNDPNATRHTNTALNADTQYLEAENHAEIVDSTVENYLYIDDKYVSGAGKASTAMTWPMDGEYGATSIEPYSMEDYTPETCFLELPFEVAAIIKVEVQLQYIGGNTPAEITGKIIEFERWKTLPTTSWNSYWKGSAAKRNRGYFSYNSVRIKNLTEALVFVYPGDEAVFVANQARYRVTYVPIRGARIKKCKPDSLQVKPLASIVNQQANILDGEDYCGYLEALVDKMSGEYKMPIIKAPIGEQYRKGEYLNGEIITQAEHTYFYKHAESIYTTSAHYNRKSEFVDIDHNLRQWAIPADRVQNRYIHYAQDLLFALDEELPVTSGALSESFIEHYHAYFAGVAPTPPSIAFLSFKTYADYYNDESTTEWSDSRGYGLLSCKGAPLGKSISFAWSAADNASLGSRGYYVLNAGAIGYTQRQMFVEYPAAAEYLQFFISSVAPTNFNYNSEYTGVGNNLGADIETKAQNKNFAHTFPLSNKAQFRDGVAQIDFSARTAGNAENLFRIQKDLRERILFCFQLDIRGIGDTIVFKGASVWSPLSNNVAFSSAQIFYSPSYRYSGDEQKAVGSGGEALSVSSTPSSVTFENPTGASVSGLASYAIADVAGNLLFARNAPYGETIEMPRYVVLRLQNSKKQYIKI